MHFWGFDRFCCRGVSVISFAMKMNFNRASVHFKEGMSANFNKLYKEMEAHTAYKFYVVGCVGSFLFCSNISEQGEKKMMHDEMLAQNKARIDLEMWSIMQGDAAAAAAAAKVEPRSTNFLCHAIRRIFIGGSGQSTTK